MRLIAGGGSGAVAASSHAGCARFRRTDPLLTGTTRRCAGHDARAARTSGGKIPEARWVRAMAFERRSTTEAFVSELLTRAVGLLELDRPTAVRVRSGGDSADTTAKRAGQAHLKAKFADEATMLTRLRGPVPQPRERGPRHHDQAGLRDRLPPQGGRPVVGSWLIMGDAKDYERVRARIDDGRMLKGFLQVALGAESAAAWSRLPDGMEVHRYGALAVPRNVYLRPEAIVEDLADHRSEVRARAQERLDALAELRRAGRRRRPAPTTSRHIEATFDPRSCATCSLFALLPRRAPRARPTRRRC